MMVRNYVAGQKPIILTNTLISTSNEALNYYINKYNYLHNCDNDPIKIKYDKLIYTLEGRFGGITRRDTGWWCTECGSFLKDEDQMILEMKQF